MIPSEIILEIYSHLGNTDKRKLRQTCFLYKNVKLNTPSISFYIKYPFFIEYCLDKYYDIIPETYIHFHYLEMFVYTGALTLIKKLGTLKELCELAAKYGKLEILKYAYEN